MEVCVHCGNEALYMTKGGKFICQPSVNKCPTVREKNSRGLMKAYESGIRVSGSEQYASISDDSKEKMNHRKDQRFADFSYGGKGQHKNALLLERGHRCEECKLAEWNDIPITLELEHIDGDRKNNTKENLKLLCPNCHSQTPTWRRSSSPGWNKQKYTDEEIIEAIQSHYNLNQVLEYLNLRYGSAGTIINIMSKYKVSYKNSALTQERQGII